MESAERTVLITGTSRGIGLELTRLFARAGNQVIATCRNPSGASELAEISQQHGNVVVVELDVTSDSSVSAAIDSLQVSAIDWLINNAGQNPRDSFETFNASEFLASLDVNTVGALRVTHACMPLLRASSAAKIAFISSQLGSLEVQRDDFGWLAYNTSKAGLNMIARKLSFELASEGILTTTVHPGWVRTDLGGPDAAISAAESASGVLSVVEKLNVDSNGSFFRYDGSIHPW